jgi:hypothetical protein
MLVSVSWHRPSGHDDVCLHTESRVACPRGALTAVRFLQFRLFVGIIKEKLENKMKKPFTIALIALTLCSTVIAVLLYQKLSEMKDRHAESEQSLLMLQNELIIDLITRFPFMTCESYFEMKRGSEKQFGITIHGVSPRDSLLLQPTVHIMKDGAEYQTIPYTNQHSGIRDSLMYAETSLRMYNFRWRAETKGLFEFWVSGGSDYVRLLQDEELGLVKIGTLKFRVADVERALSSDPSLVEVPISEFVRMSERMDPLKFVVEVR